MSGLIKGFIRVDRDQLSEEEKQEIINNIGSLADMNTAVSEAAGSSTLGKTQTECLSYTSAFLSEIISQLNGLLQT